MQSYKEFNKRTIKVKRQHMKTQKQQREISKEQSRYVKLIQFMSPEQLLQFLEQDYYRIVRQNKQIELQINPIVTKKVHQFIDQFRYSADMQLWKLTCPRYTPQPIKARAIYKDFHSNYSFKIDSKRTKSDSIFLLENLMLFKEKWDKEVGN